MDINQLIGSQAYVRGADPDLFCTPVIGVIRAIDQNTQSLLLEFVPPLHIGVETYPFAVAQPRLQRDSLGVLLGTGYLGCGVTYVPDNRYDPGNPFNLNWWRGGGVTIADLVLITNESGLVGSTHLPRGDTGSASN